MRRPPRNSWFIDQFLIESGLSKNQLLYRHKDEGPMQIAQWVTDFLFFPDKKGNMKIVYPTLDGFLEKYNNKGEMKETCRTRLAKPFPNKDGDTVKYLMEGKNCIYFPPEMVAAYQRGEHVPILTVVEGEKKAFVAAKNGWDIVGISGIWNYCVKLDNDTSEMTGPLLSSLPEFIKKCKVERVVLLHDSDALDISTNPKKSATQRPYQFYGATKRFAELIMQEGVKFYYSYINPHLGSKKYGLDDLIAEFEDYSGVYAGDGDSNELSVANLPKVLLDFHESIRFNKFSSYFHTRQILELKATAIKEIFKLNDPEDFYRYHKNKLSGHTEFRFETRKFKIDHTEGKIFEEKSHERGSVWEHEGRYIGYDQKGSVKPLSNFTMKVHFLLKSGSNPKRIIEFKNVIGQAFIKELTMDDLVSVSAFRKKLIADGTFIYKGDMFEFLNLQEWLFREEHVAVELTSLGFQKNYGFFAFSNGITNEGRFYPIDEYGIVIFNNERFYLPAFSSLYTNSDESLDNERNFRHIESEITFEKWANLFYKTYSKNGAIALSFAIACLYRDIIFNDFKEFPLLNLFGQKGSGKSTVAKSLMYLFGIPQSAISLENASSTKKGIYRKFSQFRNGIVWLDEYKNNIHPDLVGLLKNLYDGIGYERAQTSQDNRTFSSSVLSAAILSGQDMPTVDPALFTRVILLQFKDNKFGEGDQLNYKNLKEMEKGGLTAITIKLLGFREKIREQYQKVYNECFADLNEDFKRYDIPDRLLKNAAMIMAPITLLEREKLIELPFSIANLYSYFKDVLMAHKTLLEDNQEISVFWEIVETLFREKVISAENGDFHFITKGDCVYFRFNRLHSAYMIKYRQIHGRNGIDKLTLQNYLKNSPAFVEISSSIRFDTGVSSGWGFKYSLLGISLYNEAPKMDGQDPEPGTIEAIKMPEGRDDLPF